MLNSEVISSELLRTFLIIEQSGSYTHAAEMLGLGQPAISLQMKRLQHIVGGELFERAAGSLFLTARGEMVKHYACRIINLNSQMLTLCGTEGGKRTLRIGVQDIFATSHIVCLLRVLNSSLQGRRSVITSCAGTDLFEKVRAGYFDAAFVIRAADVLPRLDEEWDEEMCWISAPDFVLGEGRPIPLLSWPNSFSEKLAIDALSQAGTPYSIVLVANDLGTHLAAIRAGVGLCILPHRLVPSDVQVVTFSYLPKIPFAKSSICVNEAIPSTDAKLLQDAIRAAMSPSASFGPRIKTVKSF